MPAKLPQPQLKCPSGQPARRLPVHIREPGQPGRSLRRMASGDLWRPERGTSRVVRRGPRCAPPSNAMAEERLGQRAPQWSSRHRPGWCRRRPVGRCMPREACFSQHPPCLTSVRRRTQRPERCRRGKRGQRARKRERARRKRERVQGSRAEATSTTRMGHDGGQGAWAQPYESTGG